MQDSDPAEMAELDFGRLDLFHNPDTARRRAVWALIVVLTYSRRHSPTTLGHGSAPGKQRLPVDCCGRPPRGQWKTFNFP